jgi:hypothetical protein
MATGCTTINGAKAMRLRDAGQLPEKTQIPAKSFGRVSDLSKRLSSITELESGRCVADDASGILRGLLPTMAVRLPGPMTQSISPLPAAGPQRFFA